MGEQFVFAWRGDLGVAQGPSLLGGRRAVKRRRKTTIKRQTDDKSLQKDEMDKSSGTSAIRGVVVVMEEDKQRRGETDGMPKGTVQSIYRQLPGWLYQVDKLRYSTDRRQVFGKAHNIP
jgi:hypothetical protein